MDDPIDDLMGRWHDLADQSAAKLESQFSTDTRQLVQAVVRDALGMSHADKFESPRAFAEYVVQLRESERSWSRRLGEVIVEAQDHLQKGDRLAALESLQNFESTCPWRVFVEIAKTQRENTLG